MVNSGNSGLISRIDELKGKVSQLLRQIVFTTFIVEEQPSQVVKKFGYITTKVRLLVGSIKKFQAQGVVVQVILINEEQAKVMIKTGQLVSNSGRIQNDQKPMVLNDVRLNEEGLNGEELSVHFNDMKIKELRRSYGKTDSSVMNEKFFLLFKIKVKIEETIDTIVWTLSLPFVVIVNVSQESKAWAALTWYNTFSEFVSFLDCLFKHNPINH